MTSCGGQQSSYLLETTTVHISEEYVRYQLLDIPESEWEEACVEDQKSDEDDSHVHYRFDATSQFLNSDVYEGESYAEGDIELRASILGRDCQCSTCLL